MKQNITKPDTLEWTAVRITRAVAIQLGQFVGRTGQTKTFVVTAALADYIERHKSK